ncbi:MAG: hypothetical protein WCJ18_09195, partial [Planctomycetota bacterium]
TGPDVELQGGGKTRPALLIEQYNYKSDANMPQERRASEEVDQAYGGFVFELGDATEFKSFEAFQQHLQTAKLDANWDAAKKMLAAAAAHAKKPAGWRSSAGLAVLPGRRRRARACRSRSPS